MQTRLTLLLAILLALGTASCGVLKGGGCDCPKFSHTHATHQEIASNR